MKTNVVMIRNMGAFKVSQRTKDGMFNATDLIKQWNKSQNHTERKGKRIDDFMNLKSTAEFIEVLSEEVLNTEDPRYLKTHESTRGKNGGSWMHPFLFMDFAMWLNPKFKLQVIKFVHDELIEKRHLAGDHYLILSSSGAKLKGYSFVKVAKAMQWIIYNKTGKNLRQTASTIQLKETIEVQQKLAFAIDMGYIKSFDQLLKELRLIYKMKYNPLYNISA